MEILPLGGRVAADMRILRAQPLPQIIDMAEQVPLGVLRAGPAEIGADPPIGGRALLDRPVLDRHAAQPHKAASIHHLAAQPVQDRPERRQREIVACDRGDVEPARPHLPRRLLDLGDFRRGKTIGPLGLAAAHIGADPGSGTLDRPPPRCSDASRLRRRDRLDQRHGAPRSRCMGGSSTLPPGRTPTRGRGLRQCGNPASLSVSPQSGYRGSRVRGRRDRH